MSAAFTTDEMILNMGPHHPSTHGVLRFVLKTDGEVVKEVRPDIGYLHRGLEKIAEKLQYPQFMPYTDRIDYLAAMHCNHVWAMAVETLLGVEVPERAKYIRVIVAELNRIISHLIMLGCAAMDLGAFTPFLHALREREKVNDLFEELCGQRLTYNYMRIGGVSKDLPSGWLDKLSSFLDGFEKAMEEFNILISGNRIFMKRLQGIAVISAELAMERGMTGPNLRACGVDYDIRKDHPYEIYSKLEFDVPVGEDGYGVKGDAYNRYWMRVKEVEQSVRILRQCIERIPSGDISAGVRVGKVPAGEVYKSCEAPRGELGIYLVSDGSDKPWRVKINTGSFAAMGAVEEMAPGLMIADMVALTATLDLIAPEVDR